MKAQRMVPIEAYVKLTEKVRTLRKAIKDQQKATLVWKARALTAENVARDLPATNRVEMPAPRALRAAEQG